MKRFFNRFDRGILKRLAGNRCVECDMNLPEGFHADHIHPFSKGGKTSLKNGQALCPKCNIAKGDSTMNIKTKFADEVIKYANIAGRQWQLDGLRKLQISSDPSFVVHACPGAGKTRFATAAAVMLADLNRVENVVVIAPQAQVVSQWREALTNAGFKVMIGSDVLTAADLGADPARSALVMTYQSLASGTGTKMADVLASVCEKREILVILDEVHHMGENLSWGNAASVAFNNATQRLLMSGTPFRSDDLSIPFLMCQNGGQMVLRDPDVSYEYAQAVLDEVCRPIFGHRMAATVVLQNHTPPISVQMGSGGEGTREALEAMKVCVQINDYPDYALAVLQQAYERLSQIRAEEQADAGMIVVTRDQKDAQAAAALFQKLSGKPAVVAISNDPDSKVRLAQFACGVQECLVNVKMASEGYDAQRIRVVVFLTNVTTRMNWLQTLGRAVRRQQPMHDVDRQDAHVFFPPVSPLEGYMHEMNKNVASYFADLSPEELDNSAIFNPQFINEQMDTLVIEDLIDGHIPAGSLPEDTSINSEFFVQQSQPAVPHELSDIHRFGVIHEGNKMPEDLLIFMDEIGKYLPAEMAALRPERLARNFQKDENTRKVIVMVCSHHGVEIPISPQGTFS